MINRIIISKFKSIKNWDKVIIKAGGVENLKEQPIGFWIDSTVVGEQEYNADYVKQIIEQSKKVEQRCIESGIKVISQFDKCFPELLLSVSSCPKVLFYKGELVDGENMVAVVGSRNSSGYGNRIARELSYGLTKAGLTVVSGAARGIDTFAHTGALQAMGKKGSGRTVAVVGCGLNVAYPPENKHLFDVLAEKGAVISEYEPDVAPKAQHFPARNRIISGMSQGTIVVEAGKKSGSLITAGMAAEFGRDVFAVPGDVTRNLSMGTNCLIKDGAIPVCSVNDVLEVINLSQLKTSMQVEESFARSYESEMRRRINQCNTDKEKLVVKALCEENEMQTDQLVKYTGIPVSEINSVVVILEMKGFIRKNESGFYSLV